jgi:hypothetical protein
MRRDGRHSQTGMISDERSIAIEINKWCRSKQASKAAT